MRRLPFALVLLVAACGSTQPADPYTNQAPTLMLDPAPAAGRGMQIVLEPVKDLQPGTSHEICTWTDRILTEDVLVKSVKGFQTAFGHHVILFSTKTYQPAGTTRECTDDDMATFRFAVGSKGEGDTNIAPGDLAYPIAKGSQIVLNHHYLNASLAVHSAQSAVNIFYAEPGQPFTPSGSMAIVDTSLKIGTGAQTMDILCTFPRDFDAWSMIPHMHRWGVRETVDLITPAKTERLFDVAPWQDDFTFHPPEIARDPATPFAIKKGDQIKVHCEWQNDTGKTLSFGAEMCVMFAQTVNRDGAPNIACDGGEWTDF